MLPAADGNFSRTFNINNTRQEFFSGETRGGEGVKADALSAGVQLSWTVFDGSRMFITRERLNELEYLGELNLQLTMENLVADVTRVYYEIVQQDKRIEVIRDAIGISSERKKILSE